MRRIIAVFSLMVFLFLVLSINVSLGATAQQINKEVRHTLNKLLKTTPGARALAKRAKGILVFPKIWKGGFIVGGYYGEGALVVNDNIVGYYKTYAASYGLQAGVQAYGYALFFMTDKALKYLLNSQGWEIGVGPSIVIVDKGTAKSMTTTTAKDDIYAFIFNQKGLMAGLGLQGSKISPFHPGK